MLNNIELKDIQNIESKYYMKPIIESINLDISKNNIKLNEVFDKLYNYLENNNEINNPQNRGMFKFFDCAFIGKNIEHKDFIKPLSYIIEYVNKELL